MKTMNMYRNTKQQQKQLVNKNPLGPIQAYYQAICLTTVHQKVHPSTETQLDTCLARAISEGTISTGGI